MRRIFPVFLISLGLCILIGLQAEAEEQHRGSEIYLEGKHHYVPKDGFVPNEETAIKIAEAVWHPIYGVSLNDERPFHAQLIDGDVWYVTGSLPRGMVLGGVAEAEISKADGKILRISHGK